MATPSPAASQRGSPAPSAASLAALLDSAETTSPTAQLLLFMGVLAATSPLLLPPVGNEKSPGRTVPGPSILSQISECSCFLETSYWTGVTEVTAIASG